MLGVVYLLGLKEWFKPVCVWAPSGFLMFVLFFLSLI